MNIHDKIDLVAQWQENPEESFAGDESLVILIEVIDYASASPKKYGIVSNSNFQAYVEEILEETKSYNAPLSKLFGAYSRQRIQDDKSAVIQELEEAEQNAKSGYERDMITGFR